MAVGIMQPETDTITLNSSASSNRETVQQLYMHHHQWLHGWLHKRVSCPELASDLAHDTFVRLMGRTLQLDNREAGARRYLRTIADGLCIDMWRHNAIERAWQEAMAARPEPVDISPEDRSIIIETLCEIDEMLRRLPEKVATAFLLSQVDGLPYREIAAQLEVSERMVKKYMARAMLECVLIEARYHASN